MLVFSARTARCIAIVTIGVCLIAIRTETAVAQDNAPKPFINAVDLLPDTTAGMVRIENFPEFAKVWENTHLGILVKSDLMKPFVDAQRARAKNFLESIDNAIGLRVKDLWNIASGEVVVGWLPFENDKRRPFAVCVIADIRGLKQKADVVVDQIDKDLKANGATRKDITYGGEVIRLYTTKPKPGQIKIDEIAIALSESRLIAADRGSVVEGLLDGIAGNPQGKPLSSVTAFKKVIESGKAKVAEAAKIDNATPAVEWFAKPFQMGRILRRVFEVDRGNDIDIIQLLENQGFTAIESAGGAVAFDGEKFDVLHRGLIYAPNRPFIKAAKMLDFVSRPLAPIPDWVHTDIGTFTRLNLKLANAFWASETLIDEALGEPVFRPMITGIRDDEDGPQIDLEKDFMPSLSDEMIIITDNTLPPAIDSERMLIAVRVNDPAKVKAAIRKAMMIEPDASEMKVLPGVEIWRVEKGESSDDDVEALLEGFDTTDEDEAPPLLEHWAIAMVEAPAGQPSYLMFSSHADLLVDTAKRLKNGVKDGLGSVDSIKDVVDGMKTLEATSLAMDRVTRLRLSIRAKYELLRKNQLKDSNSILATLLKRMIEDEGGEPDPLNAKLLPPLQQIEKHLPAGGSFLETTKEGWTMTGFFLK